MPQITLKPGLLLAGLSLTLSLACPGLSEHAADTQFLDGTRLRGDLASIDSSTMTLKTEKGPTPVPLAQVLRVDFPARNSAKTSPAPETPDPRSTAESILAQLTDGSRFRAQDFSLQGNQAAFPRPPLDPLEAPASAVKAVYLGKDPEKDTPFQEALNRKEPKGDILLLRKGTAVHLLEGAVKSFDREKTAFLWEGEELTVSREKVGGLVFLRPRPEGASSSLCRLVEINGDSWELGSLEFNGQGFAGRTIAGARTSCPGDRARFIDFSYGKILYLSEIEPSSVQETPFFDITWHYSRNRNLRGGPIQIDGTRYSRGLALHSRCQITYTLGKRYRRFQTTAAIDDITKGQGHALCQISGDGKPVFTAELKGGDAPRDIDVDVTDVNVLTIFVDYGQGLDIGDHVSLGDARVVK